MKANTLEKKSVSIEEIYKEIKRANDSGNFKIFIFHAKYVDEKVIINLLDDGYKVYKGKWDEQISGTIIEW